MNIIVAAHARCAAFGALAPVGEQRVAEQDLAIASAQPRFVAARGLPHAEVVANKFSAGLRTEELARDQAVLLIHSRINLRVDFDEYREERVPVHIAPHQSRAIRETVRKS